MAKDSFPQTLQTWIDARLDDGVSGRQELNHHVMEVYAWPLLVYLRGHSARRMGDPEEIIDEFFADRLGRDDFFRKWRDSGLRLRRWLMNALNFYLNERRRRTARDRFADLPDEPPGDSDGPERAMDRAFAQSIVTQALRRAQEQCEAKDLQTHWTIFMRHFYDDRRYDQIADEFNIDAARAAVMSRTAARAFRSTLRDMFGRDGAEVGEIDAEIRSLMQSLNP